MPELQGWPNIRAVFFDAVGTVLFPTRSAPDIYAEAAARFGLSISTNEVKQRFTEAYLQEEQRDALADWATDEAREVARWQAIVSYALPGSPPECFDWLYQHFAEPDAWKVPRPAVELFVRLRAAGLVLGLASNYDRRLNSVLQGRIELDWLKPNVLISSVLGVRKPSHRFFDCVVQQAGCAADEILFIGDDWQNDVLGASHAGLKAILLDPANQRPEHLHRVTSLAEITLS